MTTPFRLTHFGSYIPTQTINNADILRQMGGNISPAILQRTVGSGEKRSAKKHEMGSDMMACVGMDILSRSNGGASSIDRLICSCDPPDQAAPDSAVLTQKKLGLSCPSFGVSMSCVGWICSISTALGFMLRGDQRIMVLAASTVGSKYRFNSPMHRAIFGDGAGGVLIEAGGQGAKILAIDTLALGQFYKDIYAPLEWSDVPGEIPEKYRDGFFMTADNQVFFSALDKYIRPFYEKQYEKAQVNPEDIELFVVHQASMPIFLHTVKSFGIPRDKTCDYFSLYGNMISAELPIFTDLEIKKGRIRKGSLVYYLTYGAGFTAGAMIVRF